MTERWPRLRGPFPHAAFLVSLMVAGCGDKTTEPLMAPAGSHLEFAVQPHDVVDGAPFIAPLTTRVVDASGLPLPGTLEAVTLSASGSTTGWSLSGGTEVPLSLGQAVFSGVSATGAATAARLTAQWRDLQVVSEEFAIVPGPDIVTLPPAGPGEQKGFLLDGRLVGAFRNDSIFRTTATEVAVGAVRADRRNEIISFIPRSAPTSVTAPWTVGVDTVAVPASEEVVIPMTVRVVYGPFGEIEAKALADVQAANDLFSTQNLGIRLEATVVDLTADPLADGYYDIPLVGPAASGIDTLGYTPGALNVYAVRSIESAQEGNIILGQAEIGGDLVLMSPIAWGRTTFAHEIGHTLGLLHTNGQAGFSEDNLMQAGGSTTRFALTEGQTFRAHFDRSSVLNGALHVPPHGEARSCAVSAESDFCPAESIRIFDDGVSAVTRVDPVREYLAWDCGASEPARPEVEAGVWKRAFERADLAPGDAALSEYMRVRALTAWAATDPGGARPVLHRLAETSGGQLQRTAVRILEVGSGF